MALSNQEIVDALKEKSLLETSELVKMIEEAFGVSAAAGAAIAAAAAETPKASSIIFTSSEVSKRLFSFRASTIS